MVYHGDGGTKADDNLGISSESEEDSNHSKNDEQENDFD